MSLRLIADTGIEVTPVGFGAWPISGVTTLDTTERDGLATIDAALSCGINLIDTAYMYGLHGESDRLIARVLGKNNRRNKVVLASKVGLHWNEQEERVPGGRPETLRRECEEILQRLQTDRVEILYLHSPDPEVPIAESAGELKRLLDEGKTRCIGVSNTTLDEMKTFQTECPISAFQPSYSMLQREIEADSLPWCREQNIAVIVYWALMKGLLTGKLARDHVFPPNDSRIKYPMFQGEEWEKNQDFLDTLREIAIDAGKTVAQVVINWTIHQEGITCALCGAKRPYQIEETAGAMGWELSDDHLARIAEALEKRGTPITKSPVRE